MRSFTYWYGPAMLVLDGARDGETCRPSSQFDPRRFDLYAKGSSMV